MEPNGTTETTLYDLIMACQAGELRLRSASGVARRAELKQLFAWRADEFAQAVSAIGRHVYGGAVHGAGLSQSSAAPAFSNFEPAAGDAALLEACERSEQDALVRLDAALACDLVLDLRTLLTGQRERTQRHRMQLRSIRIRFGTGA